MNDQDGNNNYPIVWNVFLEYNFSLKEIRVSFFFLSLFTYFERERERAQIGRGRERGRERIPRRLHTVTTEPDAEPDLKNCEIMTQAEIQSWIPD